jgi:polyhydroxyalkanoate synthesis regulator phasin
MNSAAAGADPSDSVLFIRCAFVRPIEKETEALQEIIKKTLLAGVGLALKTWDEVEALAKELVKKGELSESEGRHFLKDLQKRYDDVQKKLEARVELTVREFLKKADVVTGAELKALKKEVHQLKKMINSDADKASKE